MSLFSVRNIVLKGISATVPKSVAFNRDLDFLSEKEREQFINTVGIEKRRIAEKNVCTSDLCEKSAKVLLEELKWKPSEIDVLIFITQTPDYITPATSSILQHKLGLPKSCIALDINLGCSGYVYGIATAASFLNMMGKGRALILAGDISSATISQKDRSTTPIFSDAGSATALEFLNGAPEVFFNLENDGSRHEAIIIPHGGYRNPVTAESLKEKNEGNGIIRNQTQLILNGIDVFNFSVNEVPRNIEELLQFSNKDRAEIDYFIFHQANMLINEGIRKKLKIQTPQCPSSLKKFGNTSSATIPLTIVTEIKNEISSKPLKLLLCGFGVGLSWSSMYLETENVVIPELVEV